MVVPGVPSVAGRHFTRSSAFDSGPGQDLGPGQALDQQPAHVVARGHSHREHGVAVATGGEQLGEAGFRSDQASTYVQPSQSGTHSGYA